MRNGRVVLAAAVIGVTALWWGVARGAEDAAAAPAHGTITRDVVSVAAGAAVDGAPEHAVDHEGYRYLFATAANAEAFRAAPERYEIGMDGFCAKMGPLAGRGSPEITLVHKGRVFLFASESCRNTFSQDPDRHIDRDDVPPQEYPDRVARGKEIVGRAIAAHTGNAGLGVVDAIEQRFSETVTQDGTEYLHVDTVVLRADGSVRMTDTWNDAAYSHVVTPAAAWMELADGTTEDMGNEGRREMERRVRNAHWLSVLRAAGEPDARVLAVGPAQVPGEETRIDRVVVWRDGTACVLGLDSETGRVRTIDSMARGSDHRFGMRTLVFTAYESINGVVVPTAWDTYIAGQKSGGRAGVVVRVNPVGVESGFVRPVR
jgi:YHS domain-containing protein